MNALNSLPSLLREITSIASMERGKLSIIKHSAAGPFYKLQAREHGKNVTRYVPRDQAAAVQAAIDGYKHFESLTGQYADQVIAQTRAAIAAGSKKKTRLRSSSSPKTRKSSS